jgi:hypothetical protein
VADPCIFRSCLIDQGETLGIFDGAFLTPAEMANYAEKKYYFWFGEVATAAVMAGTFAIPLGIFLARRAEVTLAFIGAAVLFLPLFVFLPKVIQRGMKADAPAMIDAFGKNEQVKKAFRAVFTAMAGLFLARIIDPVTARQIIQAIVGIGM